MPQGTLSDEVIHLVFTLCGDKGDSEVYYIYEKNNSTSSNSVISIYFYSASVGLYTDAARSVVCY